MNAGVIKMDSIAQAIAKFYEGVEKGRMIASELDILRAWDHRDELQDLFEPL